MLSCGGDAMNVVSRHVLRLMTDVVWTQYMPVIHAHNLASNEIRGLASYPIDVITGLITTPRVDSSLCPLCTKSAHRRVLFDLPAFPSAR